MLCIVLDDQSSLKKTVESNRHYNKIKAGGLKRWDYYILLFKCVIFKGKNPVQFVKPTNVSKHSN